MVKLPVETGHCNASVLIKPVKGGDLINYSLSLNGLSFSSPARSLSGSPFSGTAAAGQRFLGLRGQENPAVSGRPDLDTYECQTCKNRKYQDGSNDPSVSFKTPTRLSPERAAYAVRAHESEHVAHARAQALREGKEVVSQSVTYHTDICPECGRTYIAGGNTRTTFRSAPETYEKEPPKKGTYIDISA